MTDPSNKIKTFASKIIQPLVGRKILQNVFEALFQLSLIGMNVGGGESPSTSGEKYVLNYIKRNFKKSSVLTVFDVGANSGDYSLLVEETLGKSCAIHAFEPSRKTFLKLQNNLRRYKNVVFNRFALGGQSQRGVLYRDSDLSSMASVYNRDLRHISLKMKKKESIKIVTLNEYCFEKKIKHIHILKLDAEGSELNILKGGFKMIHSKSIDFIQFEFGSCNLDARTYFRDFYDLLNSGYEIYRILKDGLQLVKRYRPLNEAFYTTNYLAIIRSS